MDLFFAAARAEIVMKYTKYSKYTGEPADEVDLDELVNKLSDFLLQSGYDSQFYGISEMDPQKTHGAIASGNSARAGRRRSAARRSDGKNDGAGRGERRSTDKCWTG